MEMQFKNEIKKLADIVVWADNLITAAGFDVEKYKNDAASAYCHVKAHELWKIKTVVLESIDRHTVYTNALNQDIVDKDAKIDLLEKELDGRKAGYMALKTQMDDVKKELEDIKEALDKTIESWVPLNAHDKVVDDLKDAIKERDNKIVKLEKELADCKVKIRHQKENLDGINKTLEIRTKENDSLIKVKNNQEKEIEAHESENARLTEKIIELKRSFNNLKEEMANRYITIETHNDICKTYENKVAELERQNNYLKKELNDSYKAWNTDAKNHQKRDMTLVDELGKKNDEIKKLKEENSYLKKVSKDKNDIIRKAYARYVDEACKGREEIMNECYEKLTKDDTGYTGFKQYTIRALKAQEGNEKKTKEFLCDSAEIIFYNKRAEEKRKEETKKELNEAFGIPCGSDSIE